MTRKVVQLRTVSPAREGQDRSCSARKQQSLDLERLVWDPEYRDAVRHELKSVPHAP